jgi:putative addiction module component (TIGR02574 family)
MNEVTADSVFSAALQLPVPDRLALVSRLLDSMPAEGLLLALDDEGLLEELDRRFADDRGAVAWEQLRDEV